jgi:succinate-acetate transporter protein
MAVLSLMFLVCSLRTNAVFVIIFIGATLGFATIAGGLLYNAEGNITLGGKLIEVGPICQLYNNALC